MLPLSDFAEAWEAGSWTPPSRSRPRCSRISGALYQRAYRLTRDLDAANDLVQDALERGYQKLDHYQPGTNLRAWLLRIMRNVWISRHRREAGVHRTWCRWTTSTRSRCTGAPPGYDARRLRGRDLRDRPVGRRLDHGRDRGAARPVAPRGGGHG